MSETFLTHCPQCKAVFKLRKEHLEMAQGHVRCGSCNSLFLATDNIVSLEKETQKSTMADSVDDATDGLIDTALRDLKEPPELELLPEDPEPEKAAKKIPAQNLLIGAAAFLIGFIGLWYFYLWPNRLELSQNESWRPVLKGSCAIFQCQIPALQKIELFEVNAIEVSEAVKGEQQVSLLLKNNADFAQPFPKVRVILSDIKGKQFTTSTLSPAEYLPEVNHNTLIEANQTVQIGFSFLSDGKDYSGYQIQLVK